MFGHHGRLTDGDVITILSDLVKAIKRGDSDDALDMLHRYVSSSSHREYIERFRNEVVR